MTAEGTPPTPPRLLAAVFLDGDYEDDEYYIGLARSADLIVGADGGAAFLLRAGIAPQLVVGDFDSLAGTDLERLKASGVEVVRHPVRKDFTDGELAVDEALARGATGIVLAGALGALDHTLGHLAILRRLAEDGVEARLASPGLTVLVMAAPARSSLGAAPGTRVSLAPASSAAEVSLTGFDYPLDHGVLPATRCLGLGNAVASQPAVIEVHDGVVVVLVEDGAAAVSAAEHEDR